MANEDVQKTLSELSRDLQESKARLEEAQRVAHVGHWEWDLETNVVVWSDETYRIFGLSPQERPMDLATVQAMVHPEDRESLYRGVDEDLVAGVRPKAEFRIIRPNGEVRTVQSVTPKRWSSTPGDAKRDASGRPYKLFGTIQDITERKRTEEAFQEISRKLLESNARLEEAQRVAHVGHWVWDLDTNRVIFSDENYRIFGLTPQEGTIDLAIIREMIHPDDREAVFRTAEEAVRSGTRADSEHRLLRPNGEMRIVHSLGDLKKDSSGRPYQMFGTTQDITDRKRAEESLRQTQIYLREGERLAHMGSWAYNDSGLYCSDELYQIFGLDPEKGAPKVEQYLALIHPQDQVSLAETIKTMFQQHRGCDVTKRIVRPDGEVRHVRCVGVPVVENGVFNGFHGTAIDVTEQELLTQELRREQAYLTDAQGMAHIGSWSYNLITQRPLHSSDENARLYGFDPSQGPIPAERFFATLHAEDAPYVNATLEKAIREGTDFYLYGYRIHHTDGSIRFLQAIGRRNASGEPGEYVGVTMDITERKRAQEALQRSQFYLSEGQRLAHMGSWASKDLGIRWSNDLGLYWSDEVYKIFGLDPEKGPPTLGQYLAAVHPDDRASIAETISAMHEQRCGCDVTHRIVRPDGEVRHVRCVGVPVVEDGVFTAFHGTTIDVTEHELLTRELRREQAYLAEAQSLTHIGSWATNFNTGQMFHQSDEVFRLHGFDPRQGPFPLESFFDTIHPEDRAAVTAALDHAIHARTDYDIREFRVCHPDGTIRYLRTIGHHNRSGKMGEYIGITMDITERKQAEQEREKLRQLEADLAHINRVNMMGELAAALAHEIRQPIAASITSASACLRWLARDPPDLERARAAAARIEQDGNRAADVINRLRSFYKKGTPPDRGIVDLKEIAREMTALLRKEAIQHSIKIHSELDEDIPNVLADRVQLQQVFMNLMLNALDAMKDTGGKLTISSRLTPEGQLVVSISDTGVGLPTENTERIFDAFHTTKPQGTGMGLAITRSIVEAHGGRVWATANPEAGATFHFTLPAKAEADT